MNIRNVQMIQNRLYTNLGSATPLLERPNIIQSYVFANNIVFKHLKPRPKHGRISDGELQVALACDPSLERDAGSVIPRLELRIHVVGVHVCA